MFGDVPITGIDGFGGTEIESELGDDLPTEAEIGAAAEAIRSRNGISIKDIVLIGIDAVRPFAGVKPLEPQFDAQRCRV